MYSNVLMRYKLILLILSLVYLSFPQKVVASFSFQIDAISKTQVVNVEDEIVSTITITDLPSGDSYFRVAIQKNAGDTYFGYTRNNENGWAQINTSQDCKNYFKVTGPGSSIVSIGTKVGDSNFLENGQYNLKARRYTSSCSTTYDSNSILFDILVPTPTPTISPTVEPTIAPTSTPTKTTTPVSTAVPTVKPSPAKTPASKPSPTITSKPEELEELQGPGEVQNETNANASDQNTPQPSGQVAGATVTKKSPSVAIILIFLGICCLGYVGYMLYTSRQRVFKKS